MMKRPYFFMNIQDDLLTLINRKPTVLCFEESPQMMRLAMLLLATNGYDVIWAKTVDEFLKLANFYQPKLMLIEQKQQIHISNAFLSKINRFALEHSFPKKIVLVSESQPAPFRLIEGITAVSIEQLSQNDLAKWLNQFKQASCSKTPVPICE